MKIVHLSTVHSYYDTRIVNKFVTLCSKNNLDTVLYITHPNGEHIKIENNITYKYIKKLGFLKRFFYNFKVIYKVLKEKSDIIQFHDPELLPYFIFIKLFSKNKKIIFDIHENVSKQILNKQHIPFLLRKPTAFLYRIFEKIGENIIDLYILAEDSYKYLIKNKNKYLIVHNYPILNSSECNFDFFSKPFKIVYIGSITELRGLKEMIDITNSLYKSGLDIQLILIGPLNPPSLIDKYKKYIQSIGLEENKVIFKGPMKNNEGMEIIKKCHLGLALLHPIPNYIESLPTKLFEYFKMGKPAIVSNFPLWKSIMENSGGGEAKNPLKIDETVKQIEKYIQNPNLCYKHGKNGFKYTKENYSFDKDFQKILHFYKN